MANPRTPSDVVDTTVGAGDVKPRRLDNGDLLVPATRNGSPEGEPMMRINRTHPDYQYWYDYLRVPAGDRPTVDWPDAAAGGQPT